MELEYKTDITDNKAVIHIEGDMDDEVAGEALRPVPCGDDCDGP